MVLTIGKDFGYYKVHSAIGAGGMGEIYRARDTRLRRDVAIKILPQSLMQDDSSIECFWHDDASFHRKFNLDIPNNY